MASFVITVNVVWVVSSFFLFWQKIAGRYSNWCHVKVVSVRFLVLGNMIRNNVGSKRFREVRAPPAKKKSQFDFATSDAANPPNPKIPQKNREWVGSSR